MLCTTCREGLEGIWDPSRTERVCSSDEWHGQEEPMTGPEGVMVIKEPFDEVDDPLAPEKFVFGHHRTQESFVRSVAEGCVFCVRFGWHGSEEEQEREPRIEKLGFYSLFTVRRKPRSTMYMYIGNRRGGFNMVPHDYTDEDINLDIGRSTKDDSTWRLTQRWLEDCLHNHAVCNEKASPSYIPNRLVELSGDGNEQTFRIVQKQQVDPEARYLTLSHRWGEEPVNEPVKLSKSSLELLSQKQPINRLPKTFRDASKIAHMMNISYLWIDRLCILQESGVDWRAHTSLMQDVYRNSFLCISALGAENDDGGCFFERDPAKVKTTVFNFGVDGPEKPRAYRFDLEKGWAWSLSFDREPLVKRGWSVQERLLAPRVLHFGRKQVFWECHETNRCEIHPRTVNLYSGSGTAPTKPKHQHAWKDLMGAPARFDLDDVVSQLFTDWYAVLQLYTKCQLTKPSDKLVALSGLAKDMKKRLAELGCGSTDYLAGVWRHRLPQGLIWNTLGGGTRIPVYRAPSWSWAAIDAPVNMHDWTGSRIAGAELVASVVSVVTTPCQGGDETGEVSDGRIILRGTVTIANLHAPVKGALKLEEEAGIRNLEDAESGNVLIETPVKGKREDGKPLIARWIVIFDTKEDICERVFYLPVTRRKVQDKWHITGLALSRASEGRYRRVGHISLDVDDEGHVRPMFEKVAERQIEIL